MHTNGGDKWFVFDTYSKLYLVKNLYQVQAFELIKQLNDNESNDDSKRFIMKQA
jgi:hypothetical protein